PVVFAESIFARNAETTGPHVRLVFSRRETRGPVDRRAAAEAAGRLALTALVRLPVEIGIAPAILTGAWVPPIAMPNANRFTAARASAKHRVLFRLSLAEDETHGAADIARRGRWGRAEPIDHDLIVVSNLVHLAVGNQRRCELRRRAEPVVRLH